jgi:bacterioferritin
MPSSLPARKESCIPNQQIKQEPAKANGATMREMVPRNNPTQRPTSDVADIRKRARTNIENGAVTEGYRGDRETVIRLLNETLATEIVCTLRYRRHYYMASGIHAQSAAAEFLEHANMEQNHADRVAERIVQLGGEPDLNPQTLTQRSHAEYVEGTTLLDMLRENLVAERIAIESYTEFIRYLGDSDPTTRRLMEEILANEEEHADDLKTLMERFGSDI